MIASDRLHRCSDLEPVFSPRSVSATDDVQVSGTDRSWIDVKRDIYLGHAACEAVLLIEQERMEVRLQVLGPQCEFPEPRQGG
jgi:hypothetical protein